MFTYFNDVDSGCINVGHCGKYV